MKCHIPGIYPVGWFTGGSGLVIVLSKLVFEGWELVSHRVSRCLRLFSHFVENTPILASLITLNIARIVNAAQCHN